MATFTTNCKLHQWAPGDHFLRTDFNEDFAKIDAAFGKKAEAAGVEAQLSAIDSAVTALTTVSGGFQVTYTQYKANLNEADRTFHYIALN